MSKKLLLILLLAAALRLYDIGNNPKSMYGDELTLVYDAYSLLKTGKDQKGESWPLYFSMGGGRPPGYIYATIPFTAIFGPTAEAARAVSVLSGIGVVLLIFLITRNLVSEKVGLLAGLMASITPWELNLSRGGFESHFALFLSLAGLHFFILARKKQIFYLFSGIFFALSIQTYLTYVLTIPLFILLIIFFQRRKFSLSSTAVLSILIVVISFSFAIYTSISRGSKDRFGNIFIYNQPDLQDKVSEKVTREKSFSPLEGELVRTFHNRYTEFTNLFFQNYVGSFGLDFLILNGDKNPRQNPASMGQIYWVGLPLIILGIIFLSRRTKLTLALLSGWVLIGPLASSLVGQPHAIRSSFMLPPILIFMAAGLYYLLNLKGEKIRLFGIFLITLFLIQLPVFLYRFYVLSPNLNTHFWSYSAKRASETALDAKNKYNHIILSANISDMEFAYPVYAKVDPKDVHFQNTNKYMIGEFKFYKYENVHIGAMPSGRIKEVMNSFPGSVLYLGTEQDIGFLYNEAVQRNTDGSVLFVATQKEK
ncbi:MAG: glycosyltransferase family 39 protein [Patescibacteria group bacterium]